MKRGKVERRHNNKLVNGRDIKTINLKCLRYREKKYIYIKTLRQCNLERVNTDLRDKKCRFANDVVKYSN